MRRTVSPPSRLIRYSLLLFVPLIASAALADDVTNPGEVDNLLVGLSGSDVVVQWDPVTTDAAGNPETVASYEIFRGVASNFVPDKAGSSNRIGISIVESFNDAGAAADAEPLYFYLVSAVDVEGNQGLTRSSQAW